MKTVILFGSPRKKGNTIQLAQSMADQLKKKGGYVRMLYLNDLNIRPCQGCYTCIRDGSCRINDDMKDIRKYILESDVIVYATPIYWFSPSAQLKLVMDRCIAFMDDGSQSRIRGKKAVTLMTYADNNTDTSRAAVSIFEKTFGLLKLDYAGSVEASGCSDGINLTQKYQKDIKRLVDSLA
ncbi:MAG TPA: flavodoxin family protein [Syntrophorhabdaceae bacterium]|nr:flavodoxin family protein [Syntrophorhabdaceae bacterium]